MALIGWTFAEIERAPFDPEWKSAAITGETWVSGPVEVPPSRSLILAWNAVKPHWSGVSFAVSLRLDGAWIDWVPMGEWGQVFPPHQPDGPIHRNADTATWEGSVVAVNVSVRLVANHDGEHPDLRRIVLYLDPFEPGTPVPSTPPRTGQFIQDVPYRSQMVEAPHICKRICGPTSVAMQLSKREPDVATREIATLAYDSMRDLYGNWAHLVAVAGSRGYVAWAEQFTSLRDVEERLLAGYGAILSIAFEPGELDGSPLPRTSGHLVVLRGWDADGNPVCNDPAFEDDGGDGVTYRRDQFERAWTGHGGATILTRPE